MAYTKFYPDGWKDNEEGATPITAASLNHMEKGILDNDAALQAQQEDIKNLDKKDETLLKDAKKYADDILVAAKSFSNTNLTAAKSYTDGTAEDLTREVNDLAVAVFLAFSTGRFELPLTTHEGENICTHDGVIINAWTKLGGINQNG